MAKLKCKCGNVLSNTLSSNKTDYSAYDEHDETLISVWICEECKSVHIESDYHGINGWYTADTKVDYEIH